MTPTEVESRYHDITQILPPSRKNQDVQLSDGKERRRMGMKLISELETAGISVIGVTKDDNDTHQISFELERGYIRQDIGAIGFWVYAKTHHGHLTPMSLNPDREPRDAIHRYVDEAIAEAIVSERVGQRAKDIRTTTVEARRASENAVIAAYDQLPPDMRAGFKMMLAYLALAERRMIGRGSKLDQTKPTATRLSDVMDLIEKDGIPDFDEATD